MATAPNPGRTEVIYPDSDGQPMADNTLQFEWIATIKGGLDFLFKDDPAAFVAGDLLWYPVEGDPKTRTAPDAMVAFGRPKGYRGSYKQWEEGGVAPQVVFEVLSLDNRSGEMRRKRAFYDRSGVEEYYIYDPYDPALEGWLRGEGSLRPVPAMAGWISPRLGIQFDINGDGLRLTGPDGRPFASYVELTRQRDEAERRSDEAERQRDEERLRSERLAARLRELGIDPE